MFVIFFSLWEPEIKIEQKKWCIFKGEYIVLVTDIYILWHKLPGRHTQQLDHISIRSNKTSVDFYCVGSNL